MDNLLKIALTKIEGVGPRTARALLAHCGSVEDVFRASKRQLRTIPGIGEVIAASILSKRCLAAAEDELKFVERHHIATLWIEDQNYPFKLKQCDDAPLMLFYKGEVCWHDRPTVSIVGTRNATNYGKRLCEELIQELKGVDPLIVSGLAYGIDVCAHRAALKYDIPTIGVMGHGLDRIYPSVHREIASQMISLGGLLTEFPSGTTPERPHFPMRNRIIAGMADVVVVVEAAAKGGALITAEIANTYNRDVCAFPGSLDQIYSAGCNYLIKTHRAHLIRDAGDLMYLMNWENKKEERLEAKQLTLLPSNLSRDEQKVFDFLQEQEQATVDEIALYCDWPQSKLAMILLEMEMENHVLSLPGKVYRLL